MKTKKEEIIEELMLHTEYFPTMNLENSEEKLKFVDEYVLQSKLNDILTIKRNKERLSNLNII